MQRSRNGYLGDVGDVAKAVTRCHRERLQPRSVEVLRGFGGAVLYAETHSEGVHRGRLVENVAGEMHLRKLVLTRETHAQTVVVPIVTERHGGRDACREKVVAVDCAVAAHLMSRKTGTCVDGGVKSEILVVKRKGGFLVVVVPKEAGLQNAVAQLVLRHCRNAKSDILCVGVEIQRQPAMEVEKVFPMVVIRWMIVCCGVVRKTFRHGVFCRSGGYCLAVEVVNCLSATYTESVAENGAAHRCETTVGQMFAIVARGESTYPETVVGDGDFFAVPQLHHPRNSRTVGEVEQSAVVHCCASDIVGEGPGHGFYAVVVV